MDIFHLFSSKGVEWLPLLSALWLKSIVLLASAALLARFLRRSSASIRHRIWLAAMAALLILPLASVALPQIDLPLLPSWLFSDQVAVQAGPSYSSVEIFDKAGETGSSHSAARSSDGAVPDVHHRQPNRFSFPSVVVLIWITGVAFLLARFVIGTLHVHRLLRRSREPADKSWSRIGAELEQELGLKRKVRLRIGDAGIMPMTCGSLSGTVLLPSEAEGWSADRRRVVLLHELIHVKRRDVLIRTLAQLACAFYWLNPLVWLAAKRLRKEQEWSCDERVLETGVLASDYAAHLLEIARGFRANRLSAAATTGMARPPRLHDRLRAVLRPAGQRNCSRRTIVISVFVMCGLFISAAVTRFVDAGRYEPAVSSNTVKASVGPELSGKWSSRADRTSTDGNLAAPDYRQITSQVYEPPLSESVTPQVLSDQPAAAPTATPKVIVEIPAHELDSFTDEERARLLSNGIGPAFIKEMRDAGYARLDVAQLIALFSNSVRADYVAGLRSVGYGGLSTPDLLSLKTNGVTPEIIRSFQSTRHANFQAKKYASMLSNGVTPSYLRSLNDAGYNSLTANELVAMRLAGITAEFIRDARARGYGNLSPNELIELKRHGIP